MDHVLIRLITRAARAGTEFDVTGFTLDLMPVAAPSGPDTIRGVCL